MHPNQTLYSKTSPSLLKKKRKRKELTLISPVGIDYLRKQNYTDAHMRIIVIEILSQAILIPFILFIYLSS